MGVEPGLSDVFARHAADTMFTSIDDIGVRDGSNLVVQGYEFAPTFSIWTTIEECLNPPVIWERDRGWFTTEPFSELEVFEFPAGIGAVECVNVEHEEVLLVPRWVDAQRVTFKYGLGEEFIWVLKTLHKLGLDSTTPVRVGDIEVSPRDVVGACLPDPAQLGDRMHGVTCAGTWVTGTGMDGSPRQVYLHHAVDNAWSMAEYGSQAVVWQTAVNPVVALELVDCGAVVGHRCARTRGLPRRSVPGAPRRARRALGCRRTPPGEALISSGSSGLVGPGRRSHRRVTEVEPPEGVFEDELGQLGGAGVEDPGVERHPPGVGLGGGEIALRAAGDGGSSAGAPRPRRNPPAVPPRPALPPGPWSPPHPHQGKITAMRAL